MRVLDIAINSIQFLSLREKILLKKNIDSLSELVILSKEKLSSIVQTKHPRAVWNPEVIAATAEKSFDIMQAKEIKGVCFGEAGYPVLLSLINDAPYAIFFRGSLECLSKPCVSVVGTRRICTDTAQATLDFSRNACLCGQTVVSGLANGIDSFAHKGALSSEVGCCTAAVLPCGIETVVPYGNRHLAAKIISDGGAVLSEYIPGTPAEVYRFVQRNRLVAALSSATVVIQAPPASGALITADFALGYNRDVMVHSAAFCEQAKRESAKAAFFAGKNENTLERFLEEGAPLINNYADYVSARRDAPGTHVCKKTVQLELGLEYG